MGILQINTTPINIAIEVFGYPLKNATLYEKYIINETIKLHKMNI